jgi:hypothetical protein
MLMEMNRYIEMTRIILSIVIFFLTSCDSNSNSGPVAAAHDGNDAVTDSPADDSIRYIFKSIAKFKGDTSSYLKRNFIVYKKDYINRNLSVLLNKLEIPINKFFTGSDGNFPHNVINIYFSFYTDKVTSEKEKKKTDPGILIIQFVDQLPKDSVGRILQNCMHSRTKTS